jgi:hypothetical protein
MHFKIRRFPVNIQLAFQLLGKNQVLPFLQSTGQQDWKSLLLQTDVTFQICKKPHLAKFPLGSNVGAGSISPMIVGKLLDLLCKLKATVILPVGSWMIERVNTYKSLKPELALWFRTLGHSQ